MDTLGQAPQLPVTVGEMLKVVPFVRVIGGSKGLNRLVRAVTIMDSPEIADWLQGGEFLLVNGYFLRDDPGLARRLIRDAARAEAAGVGIKLQRYIDTIPTEALDEAEAVSLPLIEMPREIAWKSIIDPVYKILYEAHEQILIQSNEAFRIFSALARRCKGVREILEEIGQRVEREVWILDAGFSPEVYPLEQGPPPTADFRQVYERWRTGAATPVADIYYPSHPLHAMGTDTHRVVLPPNGRSGPSRSYLIARINVSLRRSAFLAIAESDSTLTEQQLILALQAREVLSVFLSRDQTLLEEDMVRRSRFLLRVLHGEGEGASIINEAQTMGWDLSKPYRVVAVDMGPESEREGVELRLLERICSRRIPGTVIIHADSETLLLIPATVNEQRTGGSSQAVALALAIQRGQTEQLGSSPLWSFGIGQVARAVSELPTSYAQAKQYLKIGLEARGPGAVATLEDLAVYVLLNHLCRSPDCQRLVERFLTVLERHDAEHHSDLLETLRVFLASPGGVQEAANRLFVHRNTVRLRVAKIQEILGLSLNDPDNRMVLEILLRIRQIQPRAGSQKPETETKKKRSLPP